MESGAGFFVFLWILFIGWLMYSSKADKEVAMACMWATMIVVGTLGTAFEYFTR